MYSYRRFRRKVLEDPETRNSIADYFYDAGNFPKKSREKVREMFKKGGRGVEYLIKTYYRDNFLPKGRAGLEREVKRMDSKRLKIAALLAGTGALSLFLRDYSKNDIFHFILSVYRFSSIAVGGSVAALYSAIQLLERRKNPTLQN